MGPYVHYSIHGSSLSNEDRGSGTPMEMAPQELTMYNLVATLISQVAEDFQWVFIGDSLGYAPA